MNARILALRGMLRPQPTGCILWGPRVGFEAGLARTVRAYRERGLL